MPKYVAKPRGRSFFQNPVPRRGRLLGTLKAPSYSQMSATNQVKRLLKKAARKQKRLDSLKTGSWRLRHKAQQIEGQVRALRSKARKITPHRRPGPPKPMRLPPLVNRLVLQQYIGKSWVPIINRMVAEGLLVVRKNTDLRAEISRIVKRYNPAAAKDFAKGGGVVSTKGQAFT
ncbi:MAG: hypothetical protein HY392_02670 [Candidatus Diapherotrites archaeon]|nr:hypothetical protein [Candidatus Diapherotrites archaeon]